MYVIELDTRTSLTVEDCAGGLPDFEQPWALVQHPDKGSIIGVPASLFRPGPRGCLVWRNKAATDAYLVAAFDQLDRAIWW